MQEVSVLTSIHGVDPIVVNNIKVKTQKSVVIETHKTKVNDNQKEKKEQGKDQQQRSASMPELLAEIEELNRMLARNSINLFFQLEKQGKAIIVQLTEMESGKIVAEIMPERIHELLLKFTTTGFTINELI